MLSYNHYKQIGHSLCTAGCRQEIIYKGIASALERDLEGNMAELGVYTGGIVYMMADMCPNKIVWGYDTFCGLPDIEPEDDTPNEPCFKGEWTTSYEDVSAFLSCHNNIRLMRGLFPETITQEAKDSQYCIVHLDGDLYKSIADGLDFFYPRMVTGGVIFIDDYGYYRCPGVNIATDQFCAKHGIEIIRDNSLTYAARIEKK